MYESPEAMTFEEFRRRYFERMPFELSPWQEEFARRVVDAVADSKRTEGHELSIRLDMPPGSRPLMGRTTVTVALLQALIESDPSLAIAKRRSPAELIRWIVGPLRR